MIVWKKFCLFIQDKLTSYSKPGLHVVISFLIVSTLITEYFIYCLHFCVSEIFRVSVFEFCWVSLICGNSVIVCFFWGTFLFVCHFVGCVDVVRSDLLILCLCANLAFFCKLSEKISSSCIEEYTDWYALVQHVIQFASKAVWCSICSSSYYVCESVSVWVHLTFLCFQPFLFVSDLLLCRC